MKGRRFRAVLDEGRAGEQVGVLLGGVAKHDVERGQVLAKLDSITSHTKFEAEIYLLTKEEGGRHTPFFDAHKPQFRFRTTDVKGIARLPEATQSVMPGDYTALTVELEQPIAMEPGLPFEIREGGRRVGVGIVIDIAE